MNMKKIYQTAKDGFTNNLLLLRELKIISQKDVIDLRNELDKRIYDEEMRCDVETEDVVEEEKESTINYEGVNLE